MARTTGSVTYLSEHERLKAFGLWSQRLSESRPGAPVGPFAPGSYEHEDDWWAKQLGHKPTSLAVGAV